MNYNSANTPLIMKEYGRNIQSIVQHIVQIEDKELQKKNIEAIIYVMGFLNNNSKNKKENDQIIWDHLVLISDFKLGPISPYPLPARENIYQKPSKDFSYPERRSKLSNLGKNLEVLAQKALEEKSPDIQKEYIKYLLNGIKILQVNYSKETVSLESIRRSFSRLTDSKFEELQFVQQYLDYIEPTLSYSPPSHSSFRKKRPQQRYQQRPYGGSRRSSDNSNNRRYR